ncbi:hypothetical protein acdb102_35960 [Acidothermaceae bacterium B102]|nr:hypothetical protein acdb102_35960 [Acidothermaceae bacterium B102]
MVRVSGVWRQSLIGVAVVAGVVGADWPGLVPWVWLWLEALHALVSVTMVVCGVRLSSRDGQRGNGRLLVAAGLLTTVSWVSWQPGPFQLLGWLTTPAISMLLAWLVLRYPGNRLTTAYDRWFVASSFALVLTLRLVEALLWNPVWGGYHGPAWWLTLGHSRGVHTVAITVMWLVDVALGFVFIWLLVRRHRRSRGLGRLQAVPLLIAGILGASTFAVLDSVLSLISTLWVPSADETFTMVDDVTEGVAVFGVLAAFSAAALLAKMQRARVAQLLADMDAHHDPVALQTSLRTVLADPDLLVLLRDADSGWLDVAGAPYDLHPDDERAVVSVSAQAALLVAPGVADQVDLLGAVVRVSRLSMDNARLQALAQARLEAVDQSRRRIAQVSLDERRRLERDLHDGAQQQLLSVAAGVASARAATADPLLQQRLDDVRDGLRAALSELRDLAHGIHPAVLTQSGLAPAVESAVDRLGLAARLRIEPRRWPPAVESAAYFVTTEALTNAVKHAGAGSVEVEVTSDDGTLVLVVRDDGCGGAAPRAGSSGLTGMRDRVTALGGTLDLSSPSGEGTTITVRLPFD